MRSIAIVLIAVASSLAAAADPAAPPKVADAIGNAVQTHKSKDHVCLLSHQLDVAGNFHPESAEAHTDANYIGIEKTDCPSDDKRAASVVPPGR